MEKTKMVIAKNETCKQKKFAARIYLVEKAIMKCREMLEMRAKYFQDIADHRIVIAGH